MNKDQIKDNLFNRKYKSTKYSSDLMEQYKLYLNSAEKISDRRQKTNEFFLGLNTALLAFLGFIYGKIDNYSLITIFIIGAGIFICYFWYRIIYSYKGLNTGKFNIIHMIEEELPLSLYSVEWEILGMGENKDKYWPFSHIEIKVPWIFIFIYVCILTSILPWLIFIQ
jgi:hypothetical protein